MTKWASFLDINTVKKALKISYIEGFFMHGTRLMLSY